MKPLFFLFIIVPIVISFSCNKKEDACQKRYYYYNSEKRYQLEIYNKGTISFYDTLSYDSIGTLLKDFRNISYANPESMFGANYIIIDIDSKNCSETDALFNRIKQLDQVSNCNKWLVNQDASNMGMYDIFICNLKHDSLETRMFELIDETKTIFVKQHTTGNYYFIRADKNSNGDALDMANYFFEQGIFEWAEPDFLGAFFPC